MWAHGFGRPLFKGSSHGSCEECLLIIQSRCLETRTGYLSFLEPVNQTWLERCQLHLWRLWDTVNKCLAKWDASFRKICMFFLPSAQVSVSVTTISLAAHIENYSRYSLLFDPYIQLIFESYQFHLLDNSLICLHLSILTVNTQSPPWLTWITDPACTSSNWCFLPLVLLFVKGKI